MSRWIIFSIGLLSLSCASSVSQFQLSLAGDTCGDQDPGFNQRMTDLAWSVWMTSGRGGAVVYQAGEPGADSACPVDRIYTVLVRPDGGVMTGNVIATARDRCTEYECAIVYEIGPQ